MKIASKTRLAAAVSALLAGTIAVPSAQAVHISADNRGQMLIAPYETSNADYNTLYSITNTSDQTVAVKVIFHEAANSREKLDFMVFLSPNDVYAGYIAPNAQGVPAWYPVDQSCTVPRILNVGTNLPMSDEAFVGEYDDGTTSVTPEQRLGEGYVTFVVMGATDATSVLGRAAVHDSNGIPDNCALLSQTFSSGTVGNVDRIWDSFDPDFGPGSYPEAPITGAWNLVRTQSGVISAGDTMLALANAYDPFGEDVYGTVDADGCMLLNAEEIGNGVATVDTYPPAAAGNDCVYQGRPLPLLMAFQAGPESIGAFAPEAVKYQLSFHQPNLASVNTQGTANGLYDDGSPIFAFSEWRPGTELTFAASAATPLGMGSFGGYGGADAVSQALLRQTAANQWTNQQQGSQIWGTTTDLVFTMPTKRFYVDHADHQYAGHGPRVDMPTTDWGTLPSILSQMPGAPVLAPRDATVADPGWVAAVDNESIGVSPFSESYTALEIESVRNILGDKIGEVGVNVGYGMSCDPVIANVYNREEEEFPAEFPSPGNTTSEFCYEVNVIEFNGGNTLDSNFQYDISVNNVDAPSGWINVDFANSATNGGYGLPVVGFALINRLDATNSAANTSLAVEHNYQRSPYFRVLP